MTRNVFKNANDAFEYLYETISVYGVEFDNTKAMFNIGFTILHPEDNAIHSEFRNWNIEYAKSEWQWYLSGDRSINKLGSIYGKIPPIWKNIAADDGNVNSNYGYQWIRNDQLNKVVNLLKKNPQTRKASISIYDAKEIDIYEKDTPCTYAINFTIVDQRLNMSVMMRSNDLWYGFCNDQYCFSVLQIEIARRLYIETGTYYHFVNNIHLYNKNLNMK